MTRPARLNTTRRSIHFAVLMIITAALPAAARAAPPSHTEQELVRAYLSSGAVRAGEDAAQAEQRAAAVTAPYLRPPELNLRREQSLGDDTAFSTTVAGIGLSLELSGRHGLSKDAAALDARALAHRTEVQRRMAVCGLRRLSLKARAVQEAVAILAAWHIRQEGLAKDLAQMVKAGERAPFDLARLRLQVQQHARDLARRRGQLAGILAEVSALTGLTVTGVKAPELHSGTAPDSIPSAGIRALKVAAQAEALRQKAAGRRRIPELGLYGAYRLDQAPGADAGHGYEAGLTLTLPITDIGRVDGARAEARARSLRARVRGLESRRQARLAALAARGQGLRATLAAESQDLKSLDKAAVRRYLTGEGPLSALLDTLGALEQAALQQAALRAELYTVVLEMSCTRGKFDDPAMEKMVANKERP